MKNSFYLRSMLGVLSLATVMHKLSNQPIIEKPTLTFKCDRVVVPAISNSKRYFLPCTTKVELVKAVNESWQLIKVSDGGRQYLVRTKDLNNAAN
jgi:hypothetical protein